ncbi:acid sphingomyelinase-like phosphodiesterase 3b isoform X6 [Stegostoma tigrinum]|uniref:acid sphingomyelinase-like phosphodiesterase 3b isoform X6 n=1 Tax=Stegostoma tigrinum TaxID=3053191 RepID=UPI00202B30BD|nr:acid sphingomyelinase-like phosphodiesterase 3b isoform X6 [Stegostoma tigrinum]
MKLLGFLLFITNFGIIFSQGGHFWHITDLHWDPDYKITENPNTVCPSSSKPVPNPGKWGSYLCDSNWNLINLTLYTMKALHPEPDFILWTGDDTPHVADEKLGEDAVLRIISKLTKLIQVVFPGTKVYSAMGNHDFHPKNQFPGNYHKIYNRTAELWAPWMDHQSITLFNQGAFYTEKLLGQNDQRIIVLNTNLYYRSNKLNVETNDPAGQFQWLEEVLSNAIVAKEKVYIIGHVPPGFFEKKRWTSWFLEHFNSRYVEIIQKYHSVIAGQFFGHHHTDSFRMFYNQSGSPIGVMFVTPGITPWKTTLPGVENGANNPAIRIFEYNTYTLEIQAGDYFWGAAVLCLVLFCSVVVQLFSWFWFAGDREQLKSLSDSGLLPSFKTTVGDGALRLLHGLQLGFLVSLQAEAETGESFTKRSTVLI